MSEQQSLFDLPVRPRPFVKWVGGKGQLLEALVPRAPTAFRRYHEPFVGGGAFFFALSPQSAVLGDLNDELMTAYAVVRDEVDRLIEALSVHKHDEQYFYAVRALQPTKLDPVSRTARFIYLNKTGFNGLYRVNTQGRFNVPFGRYEKPTICDADNLRRASVALKGHVVKTARFETVLDEAKSHDFVYLDPPYMPLSATSSFTTYTANGFTLGDQKRLAAIFKTLDERGCFVVLSNSDVPVIRTLYAGYRIEQVAAIRSINCKAGQRGAVDELVIRNY